MGGGAVIAMAAAARAQRIVAIHDGFRVAGATAPDRAHAFAELGLADSAELRELADAGVLVPDRRGERWYLDEAAVIARRDAGSPAGIRMVKLLVVALLLLVPILVIQFGR